MSGRKKPVHRVQMTEKKRNIIHQILEEYDIQSAEDIQDVFKDLLDGTIEKMKEAEIDDHLGYEKSERSDNDDYRNCISVNSSTAGTVPWKLKCHRTENQPFCHRLFNRNRRSNRYSFSQNRVSVLHRTSGKKYSEICL